MNISAVQQQKIRDYLKSVTIRQSNVDELFDHIMSVLEADEQHASLSSEEIKVVINEQLGLLINTDHDKHQYRRLNTALGFLVFFIALLVYWCSMEPTVSFWDCGEFISAAFKMEVGHQPGAPFYLLIGKLFSLLAFGDVSRIAYWINFSSVVSSALTIMFLFWSITALALKSYRHEKLRSKTIQIMGAGLIGALAYMFSDTFWFSAVEAEVYALSSLFTAIALWSILKWEQSQNDRWLIGIAFLIGVSAGIHLLSLLTIPALALVYYYKKIAQPTIWGSVRALLLGCILLIIVQYGLLQYYILALFKMDLWFVNGLGLGFGSGAMFLIILSISFLYFGIRYSIKKQRYLLNLGFLCLGFLLFGMSSYTMIIVRANAKPSINLSNPDNMYALYNYLGRNNYIAAPLLYGPTFTSEQVDTEARGTTYRRGADRYEESGTRFKPIYNDNLLFPRTYSQHEKHIQFYRHWLNIPEDQGPSFADNIRFFTSWQLGVMYWRYFLWNFSGKQNDLQGYGDIRNGNWITGIKALDALRLGNQSQLPPGIVDNPGHNVFYGLPLVLGLLGLGWLWRKDKSAVAVLGTLFFFTGIAIIVYLNQSPLQVRERDYAYAGSFYVFAILLGFGFLLVSEFFGKLIPYRFGTYLAWGLCFIAVPVLMGSQGWDDHNRSGRTTALDWAKNYLNSCAPNAILITNADNDTYPLWYAQEVEGIRTDVRVVNYQFLHDAAFINALKKQVNASAPLPISLSDFTYREGERTYFPYMDYGIEDSVELKDLVAVMSSDDPRDQLQTSQGNYMNFMPSRNLKLSVDVDHLVDTQTIRQEQKSDAVKEMHWTFNRSYATKADLLIYDIIVSNNWERPVYFASSVSGDTYVGLDDYLYLEGYAYRLLPLQKKGEQRDKTQKTNTAVMYDNIMNNFDYSGFKKARYLDVESRRVLQSTWQMHNTLAFNLLEAGKVEKAKTLLHKSIDSLPVTNYSIADTLQKLSTVQNLYASHMEHVGNDLSTDTAEYIRAHLRYIASLRTDKQHAYREDLEIGLYVLEVLGNLTKTYHQTTVSERIQRMLGDFHETFQIQT